MVNRSLLRYVFRVRIGEKEFLRKQTKNDVARINALLKEVHAMGYYIKNIQHLRAMDKNDHCLIPVVIKYIGSFDNFDIDWTLYSALGARGYVEATEFLLEEFRKPNNERIEPSDVAWNWTRRASTSAALLNIQDKSHADEYMDLITNADTHNDSCWFVLLLGRLKYEKAYPLLVELLNDQNIDLQSFALKALGYFKNHPEVIPFLEPFRKSEHSAHRQYAKQSISMLKKAGH